MATINDVCKQAGVSKATVSRVINGTGQVKSATRQAVFDAMQALNFKPNRLAQALATNSSNSIGLIVSNFQGNYFGTLLKQAAKAAENAGKQLFVTDGHNNAQREMAAIDSLLERRCDAIVLYSRSLSQQDLSTLKARIAIPIVVINRQLQDKNCHALCFDQQHAAQLAVNHLLEMRHTEIAYITSPLNASTGKLRLKAYQEALLQRNITLNPALIAEGEHTLSSGYTACKKILENAAPFTALFASNDAMAIGAMKALSEAGIKVPDDVSLIAIDNDPISGFITPALSTVALPVETLTVTAMQMALDLANAREVEPGNRLFKGKLIVRASTVIKE